MQEIWKDIEGYDNHQISNEGRVKRLAYTIEAPYLKGSGYRTFSELIKKPQPGKKGHLSVMFGKKHEYVHRLVAKAFIPNPNNYPMVCHKDNNPNNNSVDNLYWGTNSMNIQQAYNDGRMKCQITMETRIKGGKTQGMRNKLSGHWDKIR